MSWDLIIFYMLAAVCIVSAGGVVVAQNAVHSAVFLIICFFNVAGVFVMLGAEFIAVLQVIVYTGAILVLVLFVLMLVNPEELPEFHTGRPIQRSVGFLLGLILLLEIGIAIVNRTVTNVAGSATPANIEAVGGNVQALGMSLYSRYLLPFEAVSLVLTVGVIGAIVLALPERLGSRVRRRSTISLGHPRAFDLPLPTGSFGEAPIEPVRETSIMTGRRLIMVKDPDEQPTLNGRGRS